MTCQGPMLLSCSTVSPVIHAKCFIFGGMELYVPAGSTFVAAASNRSPVPRFTVPEMIVSRSTFGCQCGATR
jgi:hypothetical protein